MTVKDAVHKLQLFLLEGIQNEDQLFAAGSLIARSDYQDIVIERSIGNMCGYPLCSNPLPADRPRKGRYRISLKEHKVYDLHETYLYCSMSCVVNGRTFAESLQEERSSTLNPAQLDKVLRLFEGLSLETKENLGKNGDLGFSELKIQEKVDAKNGEVSLEEWIGPSNAIEGYVPPRDLSIKPSRPKVQKEGSKSNVVKPNKGKNVLFSDTDFMSAIITQDEYSVSKTSSGGKATDSGKMENKVTIMEIPAQVQSDSESKIKNLKAKKNTCQNAAVKKGECLAVKAENVNETMLKPSLKSVGAKKEIRSVTWADDRNDSADDKNLYEFRELENKVVCTDKFSLPNRSDDNDLVRFASAEACAMALSQAAEAVATGEFDASDAVSEAGIIVLPPAPDMDKEEYQDDDDMLEKEPTPKWPTKAGVPNYNLFESEDSWFDSPPEGFSLTLSPFATMWNALFEWISSSSLAYIYGRDDNFHEEYLSVNGREYPQKIVMSDDRSSEIKQTLAECLARALPGLVANLRLPTPISTIEQGMARLLDTMSFVDPLPPFRMKQWQVIVLLFIDVLSVSRIPTLTPYMTSHRALLNKVLDGAQIGTEEYEIMKDLVIPLGRVPEFSAQSGG